MARPKGARQAKPTKSDIHEFYKLLMSKAQQGETTAAGMLVLNDTVDRHFAQERSDRIEREFLAMNKTQSVGEILTTGKRRMLDLIDQMADSEGTQRDAGDLQQGQGPRDAAPADTTGKAGSAAGGFLAHSVSDSRDGQADEQPSHVEQGARK